MAEARCAKGGGAPAGRRPGAVSRRRSRSRPAAVRQHVIDRGAGAALLDDLDELLRRRVAADPEAGADAGVAVAYLGIEAEEAEKIDVSLHDRLDGMERHPAHRGDVADAGGQAGGEALEQELHRRRPVVAANEHGRVVGVDHGRLLVAVLLARAEEVVDHDTAVGAGHPACAGAELEGGELGLGADRVDGGEQRGGVDAVQRRLLDYVRHGVSSGMLHPSRAAAIIPAICPRPRAAIAAALFSSRPRKRATVSTVSHGLRVTTSL